MLHVSVSSIWAIVQTNGQVHKITEEMFSQPDFQPPNIIVRKEKVLKIDNVARRNSQAEYNSS